MITRNYRLKTVLFSVLAILLISSPIFAQEKTSTKKTQVRQIEKKETDKTGIREVSATNERLIAKLPVVGDFAEGGIVFWVDETGRNGLVCTKNDLVSSTVLWWTGTKTLTGIDDDGPYAGKANTTNIIEAHGPVDNTQDIYAALICNDLQITESGKTYDDWYLPSKQEINLMYLNRATIDAIAAANGGFAFSGSYWSSTECNKNAAWVSTFHTGNQNQVFKDNVNMKVRAIRSFHY